tara:strand:- start:105 stop:1178 length:1074 start_codon:yes stop_codon:yes gene_type:complete
MLKNFFVTFITTFFLLFLVEIISGKFFLGNKLDCIYLKCNIKYHLNVNFINQDKTKKIFYSRDTNGFRGVRKKYSDIDFLVVGGSTTEEKFLDNKDTWTEKLEKKFLNENYDVEVVNAGIDGQSTMGHLNNFEDWFPYVENLKPKFIVFYIGLNEYRSESFLKYDNLNLSSKLKKAVKKNNGILSNLIRKINQKKVLDHNNINAIFVHSPDIKKKYDIKNFSKETLDNDEFNLWLRKDFNLRLNQLANYTYKMNAKPIFISQKSRRWFYDNNNLFEAFSENIKKKEKTESYFFKEKKIDQEIRNFTNKNNLNFISGFKNFEFKEEFFYDYTHTNIEGSEYISRILYPFFKKIYLNNI